MPGDDEAVVHSVGPGWRARHYLGALLAGARARDAGSFDEGRARVAAVFDDLETDDSFTELDPLAAAVMRLWCFGLTIPEEELAGILDAETVADLVQARLLRRTDDGFGSPWRIVTFLQRQLLVTPPAHAAAFRPEDPVAYVGQESLFFAPLRRGSRAVRPRPRPLRRSRAAERDLTGREVVAVEIDPFAAEVARFDVEMGRHDHVSVIEGDLSARSPASASISSPRIHRFYRLLPGSRCRSVGTVDSGRRCAA